MNYERMELLAKDFEAMADHEPEDFSFNMHCMLVARSCGTAGCVAGWVMHKYLGAKPTHDPEGRVAIPRLPAGEIAASSDAADWLGLDYYQAYTLFYEYPTVATVTPSMVAKVLRHAIEHGVIDWSVVSADLAAQRMTDAVAELEAARARS
jgi:hypothetical protein